MNNSNDDIPPKYSTDTYRYIQDKNSDWHLVLKKEPVIKKPKTSIWNIIKNLFTNRSKSTAKNNKNTPTKSKKKPIPNIGYFNNNFESIHKSIHLLKSDVSKEVLSLTNKGDFATAATLCTEKIKLDACNAELYILRSFCYNGDYRTNIDLKTALKYDPDNILLLRTLCNLPNTKTQIITEIDYLTKLIEIDCIHSDKYLFKRAWDYYSSDNLELASLDFIKLMNYDTQSDYGPDYWDDYTYLVSKFDTNTNLLVR